MIFGVDVGNTNIVIGGFSETGEVIFRSRLNTDKNRTADEYTVMIKSVLSIYGIETPFSGAILSSVVPSINDALLLTLRRMTDGKVVFVGPGVKTGFKIGIDDPAELGADLASGVAGAISKYDLPCLVIDLGTATKFMAVNKSGTLLGGSIMPGVTISANALFNSAAMLPSVSLSGDVKLIGKNTLDCMRSGILLGAASMIDGMIARYKDKLGDNLTVVATGGNAASVVPYCSENVILDENLILSGLFEIYKKNK